MQTSPELTEVWPISDRIIRQKKLLHHCALPYCVHFRKSSRTNCPNWTASSQTSGIIFGLSPRGDAKHNPCALEEAFQNLRIFHASVRHYSNT